MRLAILLSAGLIAMSSTAFAQSRSNASASNTASSQAVNIFNSPSVTRSDGRLDTTPGVFAPGLTAAGLNSCAGSLSAGGAGTGLGIALGGTYELEECTIRQNAAALAGLGQNAAALEMLCQSPGMRKALNTSGTPCPSQRAEYIAAQERANAEGRMVAAVVPVEEAAPVVNARPHRRPPTPRARRAIRAGIDAQASNSR